MLEKDKIEEEKKKIEDEKKKQRIKMLEDQMKEVKIRKIQEYEENLVEGQILKMQMRRDLETGFSPRTKGERNERKKNTRTKTDIYGREQKINGRKRKVKNERNRGRKKN